MVWKESASHIPVLTLIPLLVPITRVLEYGSGELSTVLFLDREIYPDLEKITSLEDNGYWLEKIKGIKGNRLELLFSTEFTQANTDGYDLIFIDGPQDKGKRKNLIKKVSRLTLPIIVIHDSEEYLSSINNVSYIFDFVKPNVTVCNYFGITQLEKAHSLIKDNFSELEEDQHRWKDLFNNKLGDLCQKK